MNTEYNERINYNFLDVELSKAEMAENEGATPEEHFSFEGDALVWQFFNGNWSASVQRMRDNNVTWRDLLTWMEDHEIWCEDLGTGTHFDNAFWGELGAELARRD